MGERHRKSIQYYFVIVSYTFIRWRLKEAEVSWKNMYIYPSPPRPEHNVLLNGRTKMGLSLLTTMNFKFIRRRKFYLRRQKSRSRRWFSWDKRGIDMFFRCYFLGMNM